LNNSATKGGELAKKIVAVQGASPRVNGLQFTTYIIESCFKILNWIKE